MPPRAWTSIPAEGYRFWTAARQRLFLAVGLAAALVLFLPVAQMRFDEFSSAQQAVAARMAACGPHDERAVAALAMLLRSKADADLRQSSDMIFRLRRARRNCAAGWLPLAMQDYRAIAETAARVAATPP